MNIKGPKPIDTFENIKCIHKNLKESGLEEENTDLKSLNEKYAPEVLISRKKSNIFLINKKQKLEFREPYSSKKSSYCSLKYP